MSGKRAKALREEARKATPTKWPEVRYVKRSYGQILLAGCRRAAEQHWKRAYKRAI